MRPKPCRVNREKYRTGSCDNVKIENVPWSAYHGGTSVEQLQLEAQNCPQRGSRARWFQRSQHHSSVYHQYYFTEILSLVRTFIRGRTFQEDCKCLGPPVCQHFPHHLPGSSGVLTQKRVKACTAERLPERLVCIKRLRYSANSHWNSPDTLKKKKKGLDLHCLTYKQQD